MDRKFKVSWPQSWTDSRSHQREITSRTVTMMGQLCYSAGLPYLCPSWTSAQPSSVAVHTHSSKPWRPLHPSHISSVRRCVSLTAAAPAGPRFATLKGVTVSTADTSIGADGWDAFANRAAGEWDGVTAAFSSSGEPQPLPPHLVPEAYREWGIVLYDWQSQCSMQATHAGLDYVLRKLMPTVGCEADAVAFQTEQQQVLRREPGPQAFPVLQDGSYCAGPRSLPDEPGCSVQVEHCIVSGLAESAGAALSEAHAFRATATAANPPGQSSTRPGKLSTPVLPTHNESQPPGRHDRRDGERVRIVQQLVTTAEPSGLRLAGVEVHHEKYEGPYHGRQELCGCGGGGTPFAEKPPLTTEDLERGHWEPRAVCGYSVDSGRLVLTPTDLLWNQSTLKSGDGHSLDGSTLLLPMGLWSTVDVQPHYAVLQAGCLTEPNTRRISTRIYRDGHLHSVHFATEDRA